MALPEGIPERVRERAEDEEAKVRERKAFMGRLQAVGKDPRAAMGE